MRFLFYSHDGLGLGHVRRHLAIASALSELAPEAKVLLTTSVDEVSSLGLPANVDTLKLPGLRKAGNNEYVCRRLGLGTEEIRRVRAALLEAAICSFRPRVLLVDKHPFGAAGELRPGLEAARRLSVSTILGLRDILDEPARVIQEWSDSGIREEIPNYFDQVLIYGTRSVFDVAQQYQLSHDTFARAKYCGYVVNPPFCGWPAGPCPYCSRPEETSRPLVVGTAGGGEDGAALLRAFILAGAGAPWKGIAITGPQLPAADLKALQELAAAKDVELHTFVPCLSRLFRRTAALVCMGGYNTLVEAVSNGVPTVCVPRSVPRAEQRLRASLFENLGFLRKLELEQLTPENLRQEVRTALSMSRHKVQERAGTLLGFDGARNAAAYLRKAALKAGGVPTREVVNAV